MGNRHDRPSTRTARPIAQARLPASLYLDLAHDICSTADLPGLHEQVITADRPLITGKQGEAPARGSAGDT